jgi:hypothetical protein
LATGVIQSLDIKDVARVEGAWLVLEMEPGSARHRRLDVYRSALASLGVAVESLLA